MKGETKPRASTEAGARMAVSTDTAWSRKYEYTPTPCAPRPRKYEYTPTPVLLDARKHAVSIVGKLALEEVGLAALSGPAKLILERVLHS